MLKHCSSFGATCRENIVRGFHPPNPAGGFALPMAEPAAPAAPVKEDKDYVAEVIRQLSIPLTQRCRRSQWL